MNPLIKQWLSGGPLVTDGGWGTELQKLGLPVGQPPELWNQSQPQKVEQVAASYVAAGSDIILTNTFGANPILLARHDAADRFEELNRLGVEISRRAACAAERRVLVFASIGPTGLLPMMGGQEMIDRLSEAFEKQAAAQAAGGADALVIETMADPVEAATAVRAAKKTGLPVVACMTFGSGKKKDRTMMGTTPEKAAEQLLEAGADVLGSNCGLGIEGFLPICQRLREATDRPLWMKGNAGLPKVVDGQSVYDQTPEGFADEAMKLLDAGAVFIGGCCGTNPAYIAELCRRLKKN
ncbi:MAG: homocysteine S-methyltransferase family protein [Thermoguttaceae bacterium]|nr:homocysteine S-methyltransferase family protein [Thermoguttaceae bacterium]